MYIAPVGRNLQVNISEIFTGIFLFAPPFQLRSQPIRSTAIMSGNPVELVVAFPYLYLSWVLAELDECWLISTEVKHLRQK